MASVGFRWLDILEKEFDKAFVDLDLTIGELDLEEPDVVYNVRQKLCTISSCFAQLTHKAQTIFQNSAKIEAELIHVRAELVESKAKREILEQELHNLLLQLHSSQLSHLPGNVGNRKPDPRFDPDVNNIKRRLEDELKKSPPHNHRNSKGTEELKFSAVLLDTAQLRAENSQLHLENAALRNSILALNSEVYGAKLAAKYLDKELAGRIQQLQLLGREMRGDIRDKLWRQLESEILLQRHKTVVRACRRNSVLNNSEKACAKPDIPTINEHTQSFGDIRNVIVKRKSGQGLGISITGGREHGVPILISELEPNGPAALSGQLYIGDAILFVNERDLRQACHREAVEILQQQNGDCHLQVQYIAADDSDNSLEEDGFNFRYRFFDDEVCDPNDSISLHPLHSCGVLNTPTAPRTPESSSQSRYTSRNNSPDVTKSQQSLVLTTENVIYEQEIITNDNLDIPNHNLPPVTNTVDNIMEPTDSNLNPKPTTDTLNNLKIISKLTSDDLPLNDCSDQMDNLVLIDNRTDNVIKLENFKKADNMNNTEENLNYSSNSLNSDNLSSPMQTSTDIFLDSEILSTDIASNDSHSPKNIQSVDLVKQTKPLTVFNYDNGLLEVKKFNEFCLSYKKPSIYASTDTFSNPKSDQSLLNSAESCESSPAHINRDYKKISKKHKTKKYFGVKTLQSIFNKHDGYSDISSTASDVGEDVVFKRNCDKLTSPKKEDVENNEVVKNDNPQGSVEETETTLYECNSVVSDTSPQFEENIHTILSDIFIKNFQVPETSHTNISLNKTIGTKKYFSLHGQNLRVGKALRLCPNDDYIEQTESEQRKEKLLARYVYNANSLSGDGVGDPDFGTPV